MNVLDLFSGIGGFSLGLKRAGMKTVQFVEIDPFCQKVLNKNFPGVPIHDDIKTFHWPIENTIGTRTGDNRRQITDKGWTTSEDRRESIRQTNGKIGASGFSSTNSNGINLICGGFPCQPFSCAGKRKGWGDDRFLWPEMLRVIREVHPTWVIAENVSGIFTIEQGLVFEQVLSQMENEGYEVQPFCVPACAVNAPHRRDRWWFIANSRREREERISTNDKNTTRFTANGAEYRRSDSHVADTANYGRNRDDQTGRMEGKFTEDKIKSASRWTSRGEGCNWEQSWLEIATRLCRVDDGVSNRVHRLKALGNAVVPQIVEIIGKAIMEIESQQ